MRAHTISLQPLVVASVGIVRIGYTRCVTKPAGRLQPVLSRLWVGVLLRRRVRSTRTRVLTPSGLDQRVHNLTVAGIHTYHVTTTNTDLLVHNTCGPAMLDDASEAYVRRKYMPGGANVTPDKSVFDEGVDLDDHVERSNSCACRGPNASGFYERDVDAGRVIGRLSEDTGGSPTTWYRVVQDKYGGVIAMHPIPRPGR